MMPRSEFTRKTKSAVFLRASGVCEKCEAKLKTGEGEYDHILPCALNGDNSESNCELLCRVCHNAKTGDDVRRVRKADRQRDKANGTWKRKSRPIPGSKASGLKKGFDGKVTRR